MVILHILYRRLGEASAGRDDLHPETGGQSNRATPTRSEREYTGEGRTWVGEVIIFDLEEQPARCPG